MPSPTYNHVLATLSTFIEKEKAAGIFERQLKAKNLAADTLATKDIAAILNTLFTAASLYVPDPARKDILKAKLAALV
jgi:hypothetical protein